MFDDIRLFVHIVQQGGLSGAAQFMGLPAATVTRRLQKLEQQLGSQLLHRSARQCVLSQEGEIYYQAYADLVSQFEQTQQQLSESHKLLHGKLKVLAPINISHGFLRPMWLGFSRQFPQIQLELILANQREDLINSKAELALRVGPQPDSLLYQQKLGQIPKLLVASPDYLAENGIPEHPGQLKEHRLVGTTLWSKWQLVHQSGTVQELFPRFNATFNDTEMMKHLACDHQGISLLPLTEVQPQLENGELVRVLPQWQGDKRDIYLVWPSGRLLSERAKCLRDFIADYIEKNMPRLQ
ncbi:LysR family transcriptional regulator [Bowmanella denitrificans]|uniref:LysR family transcriptional regulator n=1 Tax=Bowmanella denitrificans TaxID=366582 RepID=UPI000C9B330B|nr:LysR family transcriptional regulator [Bowmanella denitrificans]